MNVSGLRQGKSIKYRSALGLLPVFLLTCAPAFAQLAPSEPDPLARIRDAAKNNVQACSATGETLCEQVAPKIIANAEGESPLEGNLRHLVEEVKRGTSKTTASDWAVAAFRDAKIDVHTEKHGAQANGSPPESREWADVVAEIPGREKPDEWVLLGAHMESAAPGLDQAYDAALVIEAARDIQLTGIHPRRSIRFVLFGPGEQRMTGSLNYVQKHRNELDKAAGVIIFAAAANPVNGFILNGRKDIEPGVREALQPIYAMGVTHHSFDAPLDKYSLDFLLEGIPTLLAPSAEPGNSLTDLVSASKVDDADLQQLKRNTAIAAVAVFGIAERAEPLGPRQSRVEIEALLKSSRLDEQMKTAGVWRLWESGQRGRVP